MRTTGSVLGVNIDALSWDDAMNLQLSWAKARESRVVCICNVHSVVTAKYDADFLNVLNSADMATPDGAPVAWMLRKLGHPAQERVSGPDLTWALLERCDASGLPVYFFGSSPETLVLLAERFNAAFPNLVVAGFEAPPFRPITPEEDAETVDRINASGAGLVFVGLGCPKQEFWMHAHRGRINAVMLGVGAAFDFHAGTIQRAPLWMRENGLEWLHRLASEPRRLWRRYLVTNTLFVLGAARQLLLRSKHENFTMNKIQSWLVRLPFPGAGSGEPGKHRFCVAGVMTDAPDADDKWHIDAATGSVAPTYCVDCLGDLGQAEQVYGPGALKCMQCGSVFRRVEA